MSRAHICSQRSKRESLLIAEVEDNLYKSLLFCDAIVLETN